MKRDRPSSELPVIDLPPSPPLDAEAPSPLRLHQQELLAKLGVLALKGVPFAELLEHTVRFTAEGMQADFSKVLEYDAVKTRFLVRAGVGWAPGIVGCATVGADMASPAGYALHTGRPVISNHLGNEDRFRTPELLLEHGVRRAMNVILRGDGQPYGVLEVDSCSEGEFSAQDIAFLQGAADLLGTAIERQRLERDLVKALEHQKLLVKEINHRINNSLQLVSAMLHLQAGASKDDLLRDQLNEASNRITAIARVHGRLYKNDEIAELNLENYLKDVCSDLQESIPNSEIVVTANGRINLSLDQAIPVALLIGELITNAAKHAQRGGVCRTDVSLEKGAENRVTISVRDYGPGLPANFDMSAQKGLGMRIITAFAKQLGATLVIRAQHPGTKFVFSFIRPVQSDSGIVG